MFFLKYILLMAFFKFRGKEFQILIPSRVRKFLLKLVDITCREKPRLEDCLVL